MVVVALIVLVVALVLATPAGRVIAKLMVVDYPRWAIKANRTCKHQTCTVTAAAGSSYCSWEHEKDDLFLTDADRDPPPPSPLTFAEGVLLVVFLGGSVIAVAGMAWWLAVT